MNAYKTVLAAVLTVMMYYVLAEISGFAQVVNEGDER